jgi:hypothetical protein
MIVITLVFAGTWRVFGDAAAQEKSSTYPSAQAALRYFESIHTADFDALLRQLRRPAPTAAVRAKVIETLPQEGELTATSKEAAKLEVLRPVLAFHERAHDMELKLITVGGLAFAGLHARTVLLVTREALALFETDELLAIVAHELGHDYVWNEYEEARRHGDTRRLQELELRCDGFAVFTMARLVVDPEHLVSAVTKLARHNERRFGTPIDPRYVPLDQRVRFIRSVVELTGDGGSRRPQAY